MMYSWHTSPQHIANRFSFSPIADRFSFSPLQDADGKFVQIDLSFFDSYHTQELNSSHVTDYLLISQTTRANDFQGKYYHDRQQYVATKQ